MTVHPGDQGKWGTDKHRASEILGWALTICIAVAAFALIRWSGIALNTVATDSMVPTYAPTDVVITLSPERIPPSPGEAVIFDTDFAGQHIPPHIHRIVGQNRDGSWRTQGDANERPDPWSVKPERVLGVAVFSVPGWLIRDPRLLAVLLFAVLAIGLWPLTQEGKDDAQLDPDSYLDSDKPSARPPRFERCDHTASTGACSRTHSRTTRDARRRLGKFKT